MGVNKRRGRSFSTEDRFRDLKPQGARVYLGAIHNMARFGER